MTKLKEAISAIKAGDQNTGQKLLAQVLQENPQNETAWLWMATAVSNSTQKKKCLQRVLEINPDSTTAKQGLEQLEVLDVTEEPLLEDIIPETYSEKSVFKLKPLPSQRSTYAAEPENRKVVQVKQSSPSPLTGSEIFSLFAAGFTASVGLFMLFLGKYLDGIGILALSLAITLGVFEQQKRRRGENIVFVRATRIFVGLLAMIIFLILLMGPYVFH